MKNALYTDLVSVQRLEMHYFLAENSHSMDASVVNKCEAEFLRIVAEVSKKLGVELVVEIVPLEEGGLRIIQDLKTLPRDAKLAAAILIAGGFLQYFIAQIPNISDDSSETKVKKAALLAYQYEQAKRNGYAAIFKDAYEKKLQEIKERNREQKIFDILDLDSIPDITEVKENKTIIQKQKIHMSTFKYNAEENDDTVKKLVDLSDERDINRAKSNFYKTLYQYDKVESLEFTSTTPHGVTLGTPVKVDRGDFELFVIEADSIPDVIDSEAEIQIISPVIVKGRFTWKGWYEGQKIDFYMGDEEFRDKLYKNEIIIKSGSSIKCELHTRLKEDEMGHTRITSYGVALVHTYTEGNKTVEILHKKNTKTKPFDFNQIAMWDDDGNPQD